jgi:hypothetical protein
MGRIFDSPNLFDVGVGKSTQGEVKCGICGRVYNKGADETEEYENYDSIGVVDFAGMEVADCCWEKIENEILERMPDIIDWYKKIIKKRSNGIKFAKNKLKGL